ncbi:hypothetical protein ACL02S_15760 [Nocardia sp. 004]|uniref:hypothetical protein n=1 Tax=Nocardia sp. 004 TaxID=3385978 RepID=UPI00399FFA2D
MSVPSNSAMIAALGVFVVAFLGLYAVLGSPVGAVLIAVGAAMLTAIAGYTVSAGTQRKKLTRQVSDTNRRINSLAARVTDIDTRASLLRACDTIPGLLERTAAVEPANWSMTARTMLDYLTSVESTLQRYVQIQDHPALYRDTEELLDRSRRVLAGFETFTAHSAGQIGEADLEPFFRDLAHLELMNPPQLPPNEER